VTIYCPITSAARPSIWWTHIFAWDAFNEALDEHGRLPTFIWNTRPHYIAQAFRWTHDADPKALLFHNQAEAEGRGQKSDAVYALVKDFKKLGVPIDGVGLQMHKPQFAI
jgi:endo-1,4-beta-xylanase